MDTTTTDSFPAVPSPHEAGAAPNTLGGFAASVRLLEFDQIRQRLASHTRTVMGREMALSLVPSRDLLDIATRQQETTEARQFLDRGGALEFGPGIDFREYVQRALLGGLLRGEELHEMQELVRAARYNRNTLSRNTISRRPATVPHSQEGIAGGLLSSMAGNIPDLGELEQAIRLAISPAGEVLDDASPTLRQLRQDSRAAYQRLNDVMDRNLRRFQRQDVIQEPIITQRNGRMVLLIRAEMRSKVPGIVHDVSDSGATVFIEPMAAIEPGNRWREARLAEEREEERVLRLLSNRVGEAGEDLLLMLDLLARLDLAVAKGRYSVSLRATAPWVSEKDGTARRLRLVSARHPLLSGKVVPISLLLGSASSSSQKRNEGDSSGEGKHRDASSVGREELAGNVMVITGPNAGGKTVALKTVGLLAMMAHAGLHVPAEEAHFPRFDGIYADIGDQQSIEQSLSTFSSHIQNLLSIIRQATAHSLVLVDELGTSTDPEEGSALATAILRYFRDWGPFLVATTHHRSVARYVQEQPGMLNASVDLDPQTLEPTYRVTVGLPGRSYALTIATRLGLPSEIVEEARAMLSPTEHATENLLQELREERQVVAQLRQEAEAALSLARQQQAEVEERLASIETTKVELVEEARQELQGRIADLLDRLQRAERALTQQEDRRALQAQRTEPLEKLRAELNEARRQLGSPQWQPIEVKQVPWQEQLSSGDRVYIRGIPRSVEVVTPPDQEGQVEVLLGTMRAKIPVYQLERTADAGATSAHDNRAELRQSGPAAGTRRAAFRYPDNLSVSLSRSIRPTSAGASTELNLRGQRVEEALDNVEGFLNDAALDGVRRVRIIHGKGTGTLRRAIREHLTGHPLVVSFAPAEGPSADGVTVVELR